MVLAALVYPDPSLETTKESVPVAKLNNWATALAPVPPPPPVKVTVRLAALV